jgi:carbon monoxide dehydrogenase subunit G
MHIDDTLHLPVPVDEMWKLLEDTPRLASCLPGAELISSDGNTHQGRISVKVGPIKVKYNGTATFVESDASNHRVVIEAVGKEALGGGGANATITITLAEAGDKTVVNVGTDLTISGKVAQFGRGAIVDVSAKMMRQFADNIAHELLAPAPAEAEEPSVEEPFSASTAASAGMSPRPTTAPDLDLAGLLLGDKGVAGLRRAAPIVAVLLAFMLGRRLGRRSTP